MKNRLDTGLIGRARRVLVIGVPAVGLAVAMVGVAPAQQTLAQDDIGADIAAAVADAVSTIATHNSSGNTTAVGGISVQNDDLKFGDDEGLAVSDASGGNYNVSEKSGSHHDD